MPHAARSIAGTTGETASAATATRASALGRRSGVSKPNIYRYFESREEILFRLYLAEMTDMVDAVEPRFRAARPPLEVAEVASILSEEHLSRPLLCQLAGMVSSILEHNMSADTIAAVKLEFAKLLPRAAEALRGALPWLSEADAWMAIQSIELQLAALWPVANPSSAAREVLGRPEFATMCVDAGRDYPRFIEVVLHGLRSSREARADRRVHRSRTARAARASAQRRVGSRADGSARPATYAAPWQRHLERAPGRSAWEPSRGQDARK